MTTLAGKFLNIATSIRDSKWMIDKTLIVSYVSYATTPKFRDQTFCLGKSLLKSIF